jgi:hypothetical protein
VAGGFKLFGYLIISRQDFKGLVSEAPSRRGLRLYGFGEIDTWLRRSGFVSVNRRSWHHRR